MPWGQPWWGGSWGCLGPHWRPLEALRAALEALGGSWRPMEALGDPLGQPMAAQPFRRPFEGPWRLLEAHGGPTFLCELGGQEGLEKVFLRPLQGMLKASKGHLKGLSKAV